MIIICPVVILVLYILHSSLVLCCWHSYTLLLCEYLVTTKHLINNTIISFLPATFLHFSIEIYALAGWLLLLLRSFISACWFRDSKITAQRIEVVTNTPNQPAAAHTPHLHRQSRVIAEDEHTSLMLPINNHLIYFTRSWLE